MLKGWPFAPCTELVQVKRLTSSINPHPMDLHREDNRLAAVKGALNCSMRADQNNIAVHGTTNQRKPLATVRAATAVVERFMARQLNACAARRDRCRIILNALSSIGELLTSNSANQSIRLYRLSTYPDSRVGGHQPNDVGSRDRQLCSGKDRC
jgi:hypothetical protein